MFNYAFEEKIISLFTNKAKKFICDPYEELNFYMEIGCFSDPDTLDEGNTMKLADTFNEKIDTYFFRVCFFIMLILKTLNPKMIHLFKHLPIEVLKNLSIVHSEILN